jgi:hypothetical protein
MTTPQGNAISGKQRLFARHLFELRIRQAKGEAYQRLFNSVMQLRYSSFIPMRPYGNVGDRKNDGYVADTGTFFQVYAPQSPSSNIASAAKKADEDFAELWQFWQATHQIRAYRFAFNDEYGGSVVPIETALASIRNRHSIVARVFLAKDLEAEAFQLNVAEFERAVDFCLPDACDMPDADFSAVREVVNYIMSTAVSEPPKGRLLATKFHEKIAFNGLSDDVADLLRVAGRQCDVVDNYFANRSGTHRQDLRDHLADLYASARQAQSNSSPDGVFFGVLDSALPPSRKTDRSIRNAALIMMAYYFEACDIFESPNADA